MAAGITFHIGADNRKFVEVVRQTDSFLARQTSVMKTRMVVVGSAIGTFVGNVALKAFGAAAQAAQTVAAGIKESFDLGGTLSDLSAQTGIAVRDLYILQKAFEDNGVAGDEVGEKINKMQRFLAGAANGSKTAAETLARLGLTISDFAGLSPAKQFALIQSRIASLPSATMRAAVAMDIFGRSGGKLLTLFSNAGAMAETEKVFGEQADMLQKNADKFDQVSDRLNRAGAKFKGIYLGMASVFADSLLPILDRIEGTNFVEKGKALGEMIDNTMRTSMAHLRGAFSTAVNLSAHVVNLLWDGILRVTDILKSGFWKAVSIAGDLIANLLEMPVTLALDLQTGLEFAFQKAIEFFDSKLRGIINFLQAGVEWAIQQGFQGIASIPILNKLIGLEGFTAENFEAISRRNARQNPPVGFQAETYQSIRDRNYANSDLMQAGMQIVGDLRATAANFAQDAAKAWDDALNRPREDIIDPQIWLDTAKDFHAQPNEPKTISPAPITPVSAGAKELLRNDPWGHFRKFSTFRESSLLSAGMLQLPGQLGATHSLIRRGDAARRAAAEKERDKKKTAEGTNELLTETNQILRDALL